MKQLSKVRGAHMHLDVAFEERDGIVRYVHRIPVVVASVVVVGAAVVVTAAVVVNV